MTRLIDVLCWKFYCRWPEDWWLPRSVWRWLVDRLADAFLVRDMPIN